MVYPNKIPLSNRLSIVPTVIIYSILVMIHNFKKIRNTQIISNYDNTPIISNYLLSFHNFQQFPTAAPRSHNRHKNHHLRVEQNALLALSAGGFCPNVELFMGFPQFFPKEIRETEGTRPKTDETLWLCCV